MKTKTATELQKNITRQYERGEFEYWSVEDERKWKAESPNRPTILEVSMKISFPAGSTDLEVKANHRAVAKDEWNSWDSAIESGRSYMVGTSQTTDQFVKSHRSTLRGWMQSAFEWCNENPYYRLTFSAPGRDWCMYNRGEYVTFELPHHDAGGEKSWISRDGKTRVLVNVD